ncbi:MAG: MFS transporter [Candidatus Melainabacteria bacterium]|nr:MFS transporter [Candidatus Melainabacteria bacterium]
MNPFIKLCIIGFLAFLSYTLARFPVIPLYAESLHLTPQQIGLVVAASTLTGVFFKMPSGALSDIVGRKTMMLAGICFFAFTPFFYFLAKDTTSLFVVRMIHGFATAIFGPVSSALISDLAHKKNRGQLLSTYSSANMIGRTLGPLIGGWLLFLGGFYLPFLASGISGVLALLMAITWPQENFELQVSGTSRRSQFYKGLKEVFSNKAILIVSLVECIQYLANGALECFLPIYGKNVIGLLEWQIGILFGIQVIATMLSKPFLGTMSDQFGRKPQIIFGLVFGGVTYLLIPYFNSFLLILLLVAVYGLTIAVVTSATSAFVTDLSEKQNYGSAHGVFGTIMDIGHASGPILGGLLVASLNYNSLFLCFGAILVIAGAGFSLLINK